jgi:hypothetical protein
MPHVAGGDRPRRAAREPAISRHLAIRLAEQAIYFVNLPVWQFSRDFAAVGILRRPSRTRLRDRPNNQQEAKTL